MRSLVSVFWLVTQDSKLSSASLISAFKPVSGSSIDSSKVSDWIGFGGIRIEDDVVVTDEAPEVLTGATPKTVEELEALIGTGDLTIPLT